MSIIRGKVAHKAILDFSQGRVTKNYIRQLLRHVEINDFLVFIQVGIYKIYICPSIIRFEHHKYLRHLGGLGITIEEKKTDINGLTCWQHVSLDKDERFKNQLWNNLSSAYKIRMKHLVDIIYHCHKLNKLCAFL